MGRVSSTNGSEEERMYVIGGKSRRKDTSKDQDVGGWIIFRRILEG
jgi:hypothetical protein